MELRRSKLIALALRHDPKALGLELDSGGWANVDELIRGLGAQGLPTTRRALVELVATNEKRRFAISSDGTKIRANQGHSIAVDLGLVRSEPPPELFHGTIAQNLGRIRTRGLLPGTRTHVHLSIDTETARSVARRRRGVPVIVTVLAGRMHQAGYSLFLSENGVWLTEHVPVEYLELPVPEAVGEPR